MNANKSTNRTNIWANLVVLFALPKWLKIILCILSTIAMIGIITVATLNIITKDKIYSADMSLHEQKIALDDNENTIDGGFNYTARIQFKKYAALLRSSSISNVKVLNYTWDSKVVSTAFKNLKHSKRNVFFSSTQDLGMLDIKSLGKVEYKINFNPLLWNIIRHFVWIMIIVLGGCVFWNSFKIYPFQTTPTPITRKDLYFLGFVFALCFGIGAFTFWLGFPGFHNVSDIYINISLEKSNFAPVFISYVLEFLYFLFGKHLYYLFLFNIAPFYLGIFFLIAGFYIRSKNPFTLMLFFSTFIGNFYFENFIQHYSFSLSMLLFCMWALLLFLVLVPLYSNKRQKNISKLLWIFLFMLIFFTILWRHNAIFSVFPAFLVIIYIFLKDHHLNSKTFTKRYIALTILSAMLCLAIALFIPKILTTSESYPENHTLLHQIAGACVPSNDESCFKKEWYREGKNFESVKVVYLAYLTNGDFMVSTGKAPFKFGEKLEGLKMQWIKSILKHPINFAKHELRFLKSMWIDSPRAADLNAKEIQDRGHLQKHVQTPKGFPQDEQKVTFSPIKEQIYSLFYDCRIIFSHIIDICISTFVMIICGWFLLRKKLCNAIVVFAFSAGFAGFWSAFFIACFIPMPVGRYMSPVFAVSFIALVGFVAFILNYLSEKQLEPKTY